MEDVETGQKHIHEVYKDVSFLRDKPLDDVNEDANEMIDRLYPPIANLTSGKEKFNLHNDERTFNIFVSGCEAERQKRELKEFGFDTASRLAERRAGYERRLSKQRKEENLFIQVSIHLHVKHTP